MVKDGANKKYYVDSSNYSNIASNNADLFSLLLLRLLTAITFSQMVSRQT